MSCGIDHQIGPECPKFGHFLQNGHHIGLQYPQRCTIRPYSAKWASFWGVTLAPNVQNIVVFCKTGRILGQIGPWHADYGHIVQNWQHFWSIWPRKCKIRSYCAKLAAFCVKLTRNMQNTAMLCKTGSIFGQFGPESAKYGHIVRNWQHFASN